MHVTSCALDLFETEKSNMPKSKRDKKSKCQQSFLFIVVFISNLFVPIFVQSVAKSFLWVSKYLFSISHTSTIRANIASFCELLVSLTRTQKKGFQSKQTLVQEVRHIISTFQFRVWSIMSGHTVY